MKKIFVCQFFLYLSICNAEIFHTEKQATENHGFTSTISENIPTVDSLKFFAKAVCIYYNVWEEGLDLGSKASMVKLPNFQYAQVIDVDGKILFQSAKYSPGFKVGLGCKCNEWLIFTEYMRLTTHTNINSTPSGQSFGEPVWTSQNWFQSLSATGASIAASHITSDWRLQLNILDIGIGDRIYKSKRIVATPFGGIRSMYITQKLDISFTENSHTVTTLPSQPIFSNNSSKAWGVGPLFGIEGSVPLSQGFRLQGDMIASLLFTQFTSIKHKENAASAIQVPAIINSSIKNFNCLRSILEMGLGLGWNKYFYEQAYCIDFVLKYDFIQLQQQNMMRKLTDGFINQVTSTASDLCIHGVSFNCKLNF